MLKEKLISFLANRNRDWIILAKILPISTEGDEKKKKKGRLFDFLGPTGLDHRVIQL